MPQNASWRHSATCLSEVSVFRCPECHGPLTESVLNGASSCPSCQFSIESVDGIPLLVRDRGAIGATIAEARRHGLGAWYTKPQLDQWTGPYRHHVKKRRQWVEQVLATRKLHHSGETSAGLDLGCGDGANLHWLQSYFTSFYGSDYNLLRLLRAAKLGTNARLFMTDIRNYPAEDDCFDVIFFNHVLEHIPDDVAALREVRRVLKHGGLLILGVPNEGAAFWQLAYRLQPEIRKTTDHRHFYTADSVAAQCEAAGLTVQKVHPIGWGVPHWTLDAVIRRFKWVDHGLEKFGRRLLQSQATSLYLLLSK
jgi:SAM-dependent methyltransferase